MSRYVRGKAKIEQARQRLSESLEAEQQLEAAAEVVKDKPDELLLALEKEAAEILSKLDIIHRVKDIEGKLKKRLKIIQPFIKKLKDLRIEEAEPGEVVESEPTETIKPDTISKKPKVEGIGHLEDF